MLHDPRTGFHDIKGLITISENRPFITGYVIIGIIALVITYYLLKFLILKLKPKQILTPHQKAILELEKSLEDLKSQKYTPREHSSLSSLILREYLGEIFNFNATELTNQEVTSRLVNSTKQLPQQDRKELYSRTKSTLKSFEKNTFADELEFDLELFENAHRQAIEIIKYADRCLNNDRS